MWPFSSTSTRKKSKTTTRKTTTRKTAAAKKRAPAKTGAAGKVKTVVKYVLVPFRR